MQSKKQIDGLTKLCDEFLTPESTMFEIGSYKGENTIQFSQNAGKVFCIDEWQDYEDAGIVYDDMIEAEAHFDVQTSKLNNVYKFRIKSNVASQIIANRVIDLVYLDTKTNYESVKEDIISWWPKIKFGGILCGSSYNVISVKKAVDEIFSKADRIYNETYWAIMKFPGRWQED